ncbi:MAG: prenyltransferase/squalene oxidase repeat-containing protein [Planctomycetota bacterium]
MQGPLKHGTREEHLRAAMEWLLNAWRATEGKGVAARYTLDQGWTSAYPETTGYIIPTLFRYGEIAHEERFSNVALDLAEWLLTVQMDSGAFPGGHLDQGRGPVVFNTGQILIGLTEAFHRTSDRRFGRAAARAGAWLADVQDDDGAWRRHTYKDRFHAYHTRVAWPLVEIGLLLDDKRIVEAGRANLDFTLTLQQENGWFRHNILDEEEIPFTHTLAYVTRGLLEAGVLLNREQYIESAKRLAMPLLEDFQRHGFLAGQYDGEFNGRRSFSCLTGCAQMSIVWQRLYEIGAGKAFLFDEARDLNRQVMHCQNIHAGHPGIRGGVPGSWPIEGPYIKWGYPNWAVKFLADALMLEQELEEEPPGT